MLTNAVSFKKGNHLKMRKLAGKTTTKEEVTELTFPGRMGIRARY